MRQSATPKGPMFAPAPTSLRAMTALALVGAGYPASLKELIDHLVRVAEWRNDRPVVPVSVFEEEPHLLDEPVLNAHAGGLAEHLAVLADVQVPEWCGKQDYFLDQPRFGGGERRRSAIIGMTPEAFARRRLYCGPVLGKLMSRTTIR